VAGRPRADAAAAHQQRPANPWAAQSRCCEHPRLERPWRCRHHPRHKQTKGRQRLQTERLSQSQARVRFCVRLHCKPSHPLLTTRVFPWTTPGRSLRPIRRRQRGTERAALEQRFRRRRQSVHAETRQGRQAERSEEPLLKTRKRDAAAPFLRQPHERRTDGRQSEMERLLRRVPPEGLWSAGGRCRCLLRHRRHHH
jgi:hypothetical protein